MLAPWKKSYDKPSQRLKSRDSTLQAKVCLVKAMVLPVVMYGCESWIIVKAEHQRIDVFEQLNLIICVVSSGQIEKALNSRE